MCALRLHARRVLSTAASDAPAAQPAKGRYLKVPFKSHTAYNALPANVPNFASQEEQESYFKHVHNVLKADKKVNPVSGYYTPIFPDEIGEIFKRHWRRGLLDMDPELDAAFVDALTELADDKERTADRRSRSEAPALMRLAHSKSQLAEIKDSIRRQFDQLRSLEKSALIEGFMLANSALRQLFSVENTVLDGVRQWALEYYFSADCMEPELRLAPDYQKCTQRLLRDVISHKISLGAQGLGPSLEVIRLCQVQGITLTPMMLYSVLEFLHKQPEDSFEKMLKFLKLVDDKRPLPVDVLLLLFREALKTNRTLAIKSLSAQYLKTGGGKGGPDYWTSMVEFAKSRLDLLKILDSARSSTSLLASADFQKQLMEKAMSMNADMDMTSSAEVFARLTELTSHISPSVYRSIASKALDADSSNEHDASFLLNLFKSCPNLQNDKDLLSKLIRKLPAIIAKHATIGTSLASTVVFTSPVLFSLEPRHIALAIKAVPESEHWKRITVPPGLADLKDGLNQLLNATTNSESLTALQTVAESISTDSNDIPVPLKFLVTIKLVAQIAQLQTSRGYVVNDLELVLFKTFLGKAISSLSPPSFGSEVKYVDALFEHLLDTSKL